MPRFRTLGLVSFFLFAGAASLSAHELKALASHLLVTKAGEKTTVYLSWGHTLPVDELVDAESVERYELLLPAGKATPLQAAGRSLQTNVVELAEEGVAQVVVGRKPAVLTYVVDAEGNRVLKRGPKSAVTAGKIDYGMRSQQFAKALIVTGPPKGEAVRPVGQALEIVPADGPAQWRAGGELRFLVLLHGKPAASEQVLATYVGHRPDHAWPLAATTDRKGVATVRPDRAGTWVFKAQVRKPADGSVREQYDYEAYTATLALEIRP